MSSSSPSDCIQETSSKTEVKLKGLPDGWRREVVIRKNGQSAGKTDVYYYSPCGKKFRSKPQIARFLGDSADLTVFDFSRGALTGSSGVSHRRARDRHVRRPFDGKSSPALIKPLSSHPLGASGPIRRTCGVIKLPVIWIPEPKRQDESMLVTNSEPEPEPMDTSDSASPLPAPCLASSDTNGSISPLPSADNQIEDKPKTPEQSVPMSQPAPSSPSPVPQAPAMADESLSVPKSQSPSIQAPSSSAQSSPFSAPISSSSTSTTSSQHVFPALWENRLRGYVVHNHETKTEIKVDVERLQNGVTQPTNGGLVDKNTSLGGIKVENGSRTGSGDPKLSNLGIQLPQTTLLNNLLGKQNVITSATSSVQSGATCGVVPSLLAHGIKAHHKQGGMASAGGVLSASGKYSKENSNLVKPSITLSSTTQPNRNNITSGNIVFTLPTITQGAIKMIKQAALASRADMKQASTVTVAGQKQTLRTAGPVITSMTSHGTNNVLQPASADGKQNLFVSKSELVHQEERVRRLREQLLAAQGAV